MKKNALKLTIFAQIALIIGLSLTQAIVSNAVSTSGVELSEVDRKIQDYKTENVILKEQFLNQASLNAIAKRASKIGFLESKSQIVLTTSGNVLSSFLPLSVR